MFKTLLINLIILIVLTLGTEVWLRFKPLTNHKTLERLTSDPTVSTVSAVSREEAKELFPTSYDLSISKENRSYFDILKLSQYQYGDIEHHFNLNRVWEVLPDQNKKSRFIKTIKNTNITLYDVEYFLTPQNNRMVSFYKKNNDLKNNQFILAMGDSFTFGEGVNQGQDYPSVLQKILNDKSFHVYNFGQMGDGPNDLYFRNSHNQYFFNEVTESEGIMVWVYHEAQLQRVIYPINLVDRSQNIKTKPEYILDSDRNLNFCGSFSESSSLKRQLLNILSKSAIVKSLGLEIPKLHSYDSYNLFFTLLNETANLLEKSNHRVNRRILIILNANHDLELLKASANLNHFEVYDYQKLLRYRMDPKNNLDKNIFTIPVDGHATSDNYFLLAHILKDKIIPN
jgi:hypothetical protein